MIRNTFTNNHFANEQQVTATFRQTASAMLTESLCRVAPGGRARRQVSSVARRAAITTGPSPSHPSFILSTPYR